MLLHYITIFRSACLAGRFGGGKTSLAVKLAIDLVSSGHANYICSNTPLAAPQVGEVPASDLHNLQDCVVILDEAWLELGQGASPAKVREWFAYMRKNNQYLLMPSVLPLHKQASLLRIERYFNGPMFGLPVWLYRWQLATGDKSTSEKGWYQWWAPHRIFGAYDHTAKPGSTYYLYSLPTD